MTARILEGIPVANAIDAETLSQADGLKAAGITPTLAIIRVGADASDIAYEKSAAKRAQKVGVEVNCIHLDADTRQDGLIRAIQACNDDPSIHGILLLRPLPKDIDEATACNAIMPGKDADGCTAISLSSLFTGEAEGFAPCTAQAVMEILDFYGIDVEGKSVTVVGRSLVIGKPVAMMMLARNATVTIAHSRTRDLPAITKASDIVVACIGKGGFFGSDHFSENQCAVDVGINFTEDGRMTGDIDFEEASAIVGSITPVPRGVGSVTTSILCKHVVQSASGTRNG